MLNVDTLIHSQRTVKPRFFVAKIRDRCWYTRTSYTTALPGTSTNLRAFSGHIIHDEFAGTSGHFRAQPGRHDKKRYLVDSPANAALITLPPEVLLPVAARSRHRTQVHNFLPLHAHHRIDSRERTVTVLGSRNVSCRSCDIYFPPSKHSRATTVDTEKEPRDSGFALHFQLSVSKSVAMTGAAMRSGRDDQRRKTLWFVIDVSLPGRKRRNYCGFRFRT